MEKRELKASVPKFDKVPWLSEASLVNKPLVLSIPKRSLHSSATFPTPSKRGVKLPILFQVPDVLSQARRNQSDSILLRNKQLCSTCREINTVQPRTMIIPDGLKLSFENFMSRRMKSLHQPKARTVPKPSHEDISKDSVHYRLPLLGPRTAAFHGLLTDAYNTLQATQPSALPKKEPMGKTTRK
uniref:Chromosome 1 open reading frame 105 n=1 Tax=Propithecus coquereli TaxID=379532 RepID=A0A2K6GH58_PROCO